MTQTFALFPKISQPDAKKLAQQVLAFFDEKKIPTVVEDDKAQALNAPSLSSVNPKEIKCLITMGGDGSILRVAHQYSDLDAPILGINLGHLGFMADVQISEIIPCLEDLIQGEYTVQNRIMLDGCSPDGKTFFAINDCVLHRARNPSLVEVAIYVDDSYLNTFEADGIILATPNGSTAYSLAAGGPILSPDIEAFVLTPICPHTISNRPIVLTPNREIQIEYVSHSKPIEVVTDGLSCFELKTGETLKLRKSPKMFKLVNLTRIDFYSTLRTKLSWAGKLR